MRKLKTPPNDKALEPVIPKPVPFGSPGIRYLPKRATTVTMKSEMEENGEPTGPIWVDDKKLEGRWFSKTEAMSIARMLGARFGGVI